MANCDGGSCAPGGGHCGSGVGSYGPVGSTISPRGGYPGPHCSTGHSAFGKVFAGVFFSLFIPPLSCLLCSINHEEGCATVVMNVILLMCGFFPAVIHAWICIARFVSAKRHRQLDEQIEQVHAIGCPSAGQAIIVVPAQQTYKYATPETATTVHPGNVRTIPATPDAGAGGQLQHTTTAPPEYNSQKESEVPGRADKSGF